MPLRLALSTALALSVMGASNIAWAQPSSASASAAVNPLAREPLYADIVGRANALRATVEGFQHATAASPTPDLTPFKAQVEALSTLDMQGHVDLAKRGTDGDLKCILKGISEDLLKKLADLQAAADPATRAKALEDLYYLLRDNVEVITAPPTVHS